MDNSWTLFKFGNGYFIGFRSWSAGNSIELKTAYGNVYTSTSFLLSLPQSVKEINSINGQVCYMGGGIGGLCLSDTRSAINIKTSISYYIWSAIAMTASNVKISCVCYGTWK